MEAPKKAGKKAPLFSLLFTVSLSSTDPGPKKGSDNFLIGEQTSNLDQGVGVFVGGLQPTRIAL